MEGSESITESLAENWIADSGASFHMTHLADLLSDVRLCDDKVRIGDNHLIDVVGCGTRTVRCGLHAGLGVRFVFANGRA